MKDNNYKFMLLTGKYLPEEKIQLGGTCLFFSNYNSNGDMIYHENSEGYWEKNEFNDQGRMTYTENSNGGWLKHEFNDQGNAIYYEDSTNGVLLDER